MSYKLQVYTGDRPGAGTDANIKILFYDDCGTKTPEFKLDTFFRNDFERGGMDEFTVKLPSELQFGCVKKIEFWRDSVGLGSSWYLDRISVIDEARTYVYEFPVFRWIRTDHHYVIEHLDTSLPQFDEQKEQRQMELEEKRELYKLKVKVPGLPIQVDQIPSDENFSTEYRWDMKKLKYKLALDTLIVRVKSGKWTDLESLKNIYVTHHLPKPEATETWREDSHFGDQRVSGVNPVMIKLCTHIPEKFGVTEEMVKPFLEGLTLNEAIQQNRLFIVDLKINEDVPCQNDSFVLCSPIALFFETSCKQLMPIAIQLFQSKLEPGNPVFLPSDPPMTWLLAKMWYNNADSAVHQALTHLGLTHLIMEGIAAITHRNLSPTHPIFKLLAPHFLYLIAINTLGLQALINEGGWVDSVQGIGIKGTFFLIAKGVKTWRMDVEGTIPEELRQRGLLDDKILSYYPYRDDVMLLYDAIHSYVKSIVNLYYGEYVCG
ncbi:polyunsaturated fatty acid 5-lipoxygenase-like isoform X2 [Liolophura sinensis]|uniref:polyunsaturated fatty acid 5-lipoxygenase-like isoform X2 n=1 Tax=Liolophura sinensis TaxID=3198878 RepID=UPI003158C5CF